LLAVRILVCSLPVVIQFPLPPPGVYVALPSDGEGKTEEDSAGLRDVLDSKYAAHFFLDDLFDLDEMEYNA